MIFAQTIAAQTMSHTSPPSGYGQPPSMFSLFDPNYDYLVNGGTSVANVGDSTVSISGFTSAAKRVDIIGVTLTLQRWTGDSWVNVYTSPNRELSSASYDYREYEVNVQTGYYYRSMSYHWTEHGDVKEDGILYSGSILIE